MKIRVLGAHNMETAQTKHTCFLIDDSLAIDAGSLMTALTSDENNRLRAILLTHRHFDHVRDLPSLGLQTMDNGVTVDAYALLADAFMSAARGEAPTPCEPEAGARVLEFTAAVRAAAESRRTQPVGGP